MSTSEVFSNTTNVAVRLFEQNGLLSGVHLIQSVEGVVPVEVALIVAKSTGGELTPEDIYKFVSWLIEQNQNQFTTDQTGSLIALLLNKAGIPSDYNRSDKEVNFRDRMSTNGIILT